MLQIPYQADVDLNRIRNRLNFGFITIFAVTFVMLLELEVGFVFTLDLLNTSSQAYIDLEEEVRPFLVMEFPSNVEFKLITFRNGSEAVIVV